MRQNSDMGGMGYSAMSRSAQIVLSGEQHAPELIAFDGSFLLDGVGPLTPRITWTWDGAIPPTWRLEYSLNGGETWEGFFGVIMSGNIFDSDLGVYKSFNVNFNNTYRVIVGDADGNADPAFAPSNAVTIGPAPP